MDYEVTYEVGYRDRPGDFSSQQTETVWSVPDHLEGDALIVHLVNAIEDSSSAMGSIHILEIRAV